MADEVLRAKRRRKDGLPSILKNGRSPSKVKKQLRFAEGLNQIFEIPKVCNVNRVAIPVPAAPEALSEPPSCKNSSPDNIVWTGEPLALGAPGGDGLGPPGASPDPPAGYVADLELYGQQFSSAVRSMLAPPSAVDVQLPEIALADPQVCDLKQALPQNLDDIEEELLLQSG